MTLLSEKDQQHVTSVTDQKEHQKPWRSLLSGTLGMLNPQLGAEIQGSSQTRKPLIRVRRSRAPAYLRSPAVTCRSPAAFRSSSEPDSGPVFAGRNRFRCTSPPCLSVGEKLHRQETWQASSTMVPCLFRFLPEQEADAVQNKSIFFINQNKDLLLIVWL